MNAIHSGNGGVNINASAMTQLGHAWDAHEFVEFANALAPNTSNVNSGGLVGARMFAASDYFVRPSLK